MKATIRSAVLAACAVVSVTAASAQPLVTYSFTGAAGNEVTFPPDAQPANATASDVSRGPGLTPSSNANTFSATAFTTEATPDLANDFYELTVTPNAGFELDLTELQLDERRSSTGIRNWEVRSSLDGYGAALATFAVPDDDLTRSNQSIALGAEFQDLAATVTFRIYGYASESGAGSWRIDNVEVYGTVIPTSGTTTTVQFASSGATVSEAAGSATLTVTISNPAAGAATTADVVLTSGSAADLGGYTTQTVTFPAGSSAPRTVTVTITDDATPEPDESFTFALQNVSGGDDATAGSPATFTLVVEDDDQAPPAAVVISEFMPDPDDAPDTAGEWFEVYNNAATAVDLQGWAIRSGTTTHTIGSSVVVPAFGFAVLCLNADTSANGGLACDYDYASINLNNTTADDLVLEDPDGAVVDSVGYGPATAFPAVAEGASTVFTGGPAADNNDGANWATALYRERRYSPLTAGTDLGSPGTSGDQQALRPSQRTSAGAGWRMLSAPVVGASIEASLGAISLVQGIPGEYPAAGANLYTGYNGVRSQTTTTVNQGYVEPASDAVVLEPGRGLIWYLYEGAFDPGQPENGTSINAGVPLTLHAAGPGEPADATVAFTSAERAAGADRFYLVGNPFDAGFDVGGVSASDGAGALPLQATFQTWNPATAAYTPLVAGDPVTRVAATWQGFFAEASRDATLPATFAFDDAARRPDVPLVGLTAEPPTNAARGVALRWVGLRLNGLTADGATVGDEATALFTDEGADGWDRYDATKLGPLSSPYALVSFGGERDGEAVRKAVDSRPLDPAAAVAMPVAFTATSAGAYALTWPRLDNVPADWRLTLADTEAGQTVDLRASERYDFTSEPVEGRERFVLTVVPSGTVGAEGDLPGGFALSGAAPNPTAGALRLTLRVDEPQRVTAEVFDVLGRRVATLFEGEVAAGAAQPLALDVAALPAGSYVVRVTGAAFAEVRRFTVVR